MFNGFEKSNEFHLKTAEAYLKINNEPEFLKELSELHESMIEELKVLDQNEDIYFDYELEDRLKERVDNFTKEEFLSCIHSMIPRAFCDDEIIGNNLVEITATINHRYPQ